MMRTLKLSAVLFIFASVLLLNGCSTEREDLLIRNQAQQRTIDDLRAELDAARLQLDQLQRQLEAAEGRGGVELDALRQQIAALQEDIAAKDVIIEEMQKQLLASGTALPPELSTLLEDFARANNNIVSFDAERGIVKFNSDLLFDVGSDQVAASAVAAVNSLSSILNTEEGKNFDIIIAGHTDDIPIQKPETLAKHPTNLHLSAHRAISVEEVMEKANIDPKRMSVRGFGEYRPVEANAPDKKGNEKNRRVEIYIIAQGA